MALIKNFQSADMQRHSIHEAVEGTISAFEVNGERVVQVDSYGSPGRKFAGKKSQSMQFDAESGRELYLALKTHFGF